MRRLAALPLRMVCRNSAHRVLRLREVHTVATNNFNAGHMNSAIRRRSALVLYCSVGLIGCMPQPAQVSRLSRDRLPICPGPAAPADSEWPVSESAADTAKVQIRSEPKDSSTALKPELRSRIQAAKALERHYPPELRQSGAGGLVIVRLEIDAEGIVQKADISRSSGSVLLDRAALAGVREWRFTPAVENGCRTSVWIEHPVSFGR